MTITIYYGYSVWTLTNKSQPVKAPIADKDGKTVKEMKDTDRFEEPQTLSPFFSPRNGITNKLGKRDKQ